MAHLTYLQLEPDAKERYSDRRLHQRNACRSWLKKSETNILVVPDPPLEELCRHRKLLP